MSKGALRDSAAWPRAICRPGGRPLESLVEALTKIKDFSLGQGTYADSFFQTIVALRCSPDSWHRSVLGGLRALPSAPRLVLLIDQFEELFTLAAKSEDAAAAAGLTTSTAAAVRTASARGRAFATSTSVSGWFLPPGSRRISVRPLELGDVRAAWAVMASAAKQP